ncbi:hypothetical protein FRX31_033019 [Thalictrum thalictroides]|uniref:Uncharacterized protein n=1 Tax=Thalictrum thalictroides TaxID=46969 RepID=A0A7J6UY90_THATH|nr:hypothetical protein FRX31_033019 [Thalictrum thalictroides]
MQLRGYWGLRTMDMVMNGQDAMHIVLTTDQENSAPAPANQKTQTFLVRPSFCNFVKPFDHV